MHLQFFVHTAVDCVQHGLSQVRTGTEELHLLTNDHWRYAACDRVVVGVEVWTHQVVVFVLQGRSIDRYFRCITLEAFWQSFRPQDGHVWLWRWTHGVQGVQETEAVLGNQGTTVQTHTGQGFGCPDWVAREQGIVFWSTQETYHTQFHNEMVNHFLRFLFSDQTGLQVTLNEDVQESRGTTQRHCRAVLRLNCSQVAEVSPLNRFFSVLSRTGDVETVLSSHLFDLAQSAVLFCDFFTQLDGHFQIFAVFQTRLQGTELCELVRHQEVDTVQRDTTVVTDDTATAVGIRQTSQNARLTATQDVRSINVEHALVVSLTVFGEDLLNHWVQFTTVNFAGTLNHLDAAEWDQRTLQRRVSLQTNDSFQRLVDITGIVRSNGRRQVSIKVNRRVSAVFFFDAFHDGIPQLGGSFSCTSQERFVTFIRSVVLLDEVTNVDSVLPFAGGKAFPSVSEVWI